MYIICTLALTVLAQLFFPKEAGGSLLYDPGGNFAGSALIRQIEKHKGKNQYKLFDQKQGD